MRWHCPGSSPVPAGFRPRFPTGREPASGAAFVKLDRALGFPLKVYRLSGLSLVWLDLPLFLRLFRRAHDFH